jgi:hypothetical protein
VRVWPGLDRYSTAARVLIRTACWYCGAPEEAQVPRDLPAFFYCPACQVRWTARFAPTGTPGTPEPRSDRRRSARERGLGSP